MKLLWIILCCWWLGYCGTSGLLLTKIPLEKQSYLPDHVFQETYTGSAFVCARECLKRSLCHSFNFRKSLNKLCQLNIEPVGSWSLLPTNGSVFAMRQDIPQSIAGPCASHACPDWTVCTVGAGGGTVCDDNIDVPKTCGSPPVIPDTAVSNIDNKYLSTANYTCNEQYLNGTTQSVCRANGQWTLPTISCGVDGGWGTWSSYSACSVTCGGGSTTRTRQCNNPTPIGAGANCPNPTTDSTEALSCNTALCPVDGGWGIWSSYSACSVTCGEGSKTRTRQCNNPTPIGAGANCPNPTTDSTETSSCNTALCPVDGGWGTWSGYSACSVTCGGGSKTRTRQCNNPTPIGAGANCPNPTTDNTEVLSCNTELCPVQCNLIQSERFGTKRTYTGTTEGSQVLYECLDSTWKYFSGQINITTCQANGQWQPVPDMFCIPTTCYALHPFYGYIYVGTTTQTKFGDTCKRFDNKNSPYDDLSWFPFDASMDEVSNNCRPTKEPTKFERPWCYWSFGPFGIRLYDYCNIPACT